MNGVSCRALGLVIDGARKGEVSLDDLTEGLDVSRDYVSNPSNRISWDVFTSIIDRLERQLGGPESLRRFGRDNVATDTFRIFKAVGRALSHPRDIYFMGARWMGPSLFPMTHAEMVEFSDGRLVQRLTIREGHRDCPAFFHVVQGCLAAAPVSLGHGYSKVEIDLKPRCATFTIHPTTTSRGWLGKAIRSIRAPVAIPSMLRELEQQQLTLAENYHEIREAHDQIAAQADDLAKVNSIGRRLSEHIDLDRVASLLIRIMLEELEITGVELSLIRNEIPMQPASMSSDNSSDNQPAFVRRGGRTDGKSDRTYLLEAAARPLGSLQIWRSDGDHGGASAALLDRLVPWIAMALDNARTYEALERHAADLEQRVKERTARLLAANHHLVREIDERQRATDALMQSEAQLRAAERLASIGTLAAGIAHEINNPVGSILAAAQLALLVREDRDSDLQVTESLEDIVTQAKRCGEIVRSVLQFSRDERTEKWDYRINDVITRSVRLTASFADDKAARIQTHLPERSPWARINPIQIEQAIVNLLRNAIEAGGSEIQVRLSEQRAEGLALIEICDDGRGVSSDDRLRICEPFYTTKQEVGGTGLGLSVVHGIAAEHGGTLSINANSNRGVAVLFTIPTCPMPTPPLAPLPPIAEKPDENRPS